MKKIRFLFYFLVLIPIRDVISIDVSRSRDDALPDMFKKIQYSK